MPNTSPPITDTLTLSNYQKQIEIHSPAFIPLMTFMILPNMELQEIQNLQKMGVVAGKLYPSKVTYTENGVKNIEDLFSTLEILENLDIVLSIHGEVFQENSLDAEEFFLQHWLPKIIKKFPNLRIVLEHISCKKSVNFVKEYNNFQKLVATITPHHLSVTIENLLGSHFRPFLFCKPIVKKKEDKEALREAAFSASDGFFLGTDSAPHSIATKLSSSCPPGIFCAPIAIPLLAQIFAEIEKSQFAKRLEKFCSINGSTFYKLPINKEKIVLEKKINVVHSEVHDVKTFMEGESLSWKLSPKNFF